MEPQAMLRKGWSSCSDILTVIVEQSCHAQQIGNCLDESMGDHSDIFSGAGEVRGDRLAGEFLDSSSNLYIAV